MTNFFGTVAEISGVNATFFYCCKTPVEPIVEQNKQIVPLLGVVFV